MDPARMAEIRSSTLGLRFDNQPENEQILRAMVYDLLMELDSNMHLWHFHDAPEEYRALSDHGGDEDYILFVPDNIDTPYWAHDTGPLGTCAVQTAKVMGGTIYIGAHS